MSETGVYIEVTVISSAHVRVQTCDVYDFGSDSILKHKFHDFRLLTSQGK